MTQNTSDALFSYLSGLLWSLDGVSQSLKYHPESDALFHSLQVFAVAHQQSDDPELWLAALLHDVGKAVDSKHHCTIGADMLRGVVSERVVWLVEHHLDLVISPNQTRQRWAQTKQLADLTALRHWDQAGRDPYAEVMSPEQALELILPSLPAL